MPMQETQDIDAMTDAEKVAWLVQRMASLEAQNDALAKQASDFAADVSAANSRIADLECRLAEERAEKLRLIEQVRLAGMRYFGCKSERVVPGQMPLFNDPEAEGDPAAAEPEIDDALPRRPRRRGGKRVIDYDRLETAVVEHVIPAGQLACPECGCALEEMKVEVTRRLRMVPAHLVVEEHRRHVYRCAECCGANAAGGEGGAVIVRAPQPEPPIPGSFATPSLLSWIINAKYSNSMPLYRIEADLRTIGAGISRQSMANWVVNVHARWLSKVHARLKAELLSHDLMHADETRVQVLREPGRAPGSMSYMWLFCSSAHDVPVYAYEYHPTRGRSVPEDFLRGWEGTLTTDGYGPYYTLANGKVTNTCCLVHIRRKFAEIVKAAGGDAKCAGADSVALEGRKRIDAMFKVDRGFDGMPAEERKAARERELRPLMEAFSEWVSAQVPKASPGLALDKALRYARDYWPYMMNVLADGRLALDNNIAERAIKPFVIGRKNWMFSNTPKGAKASAAVYSIVTTAKMNGLNPRRYVEWLLEEMPNAGELTDEVVDGFLPWSDKVPESLLMSAKAAAKAKEMEDDPIVDVDPAFLEGEDH